MTAQKITVGNLWHGVLSTLVIAGHFPVRRGVLSSVPSSAIRRRVYQLKFHVLMPSIAG